jgi:hypothetical protein
VVGRGYFQTRGKTFVLQFCIALLKLYYVVVVGGGFCGVVFTTVYLSTPIAGHASTSPFRPRRASP